MNAGHERNHVLRERLRDEKLLTPAVAAQLEQPWRTNGVIVQAVFFVLASIALGAFYGLCHVFDVPKPGIVAGLAAIVVAEYLIGSKRWFGTGVEAALWLGGLICLITELPRSGSKESILVVAAAFAVSGARVRNPLLGAIAAALVAYYAEDRFDLGVIVALVMAGGALLALLRTWQRPSTEWLFIAVSLLLPIVGRAFADAEWRTTTLALYAVFAAVALLLGITRRHHAFFFAAMIGVAISVTDLALDLVLPPETKFAVAGALLLAIAFAVSRALRDRTSGFVLTRARFTSFDDDLELAATFAMKPETARIETEKSGGGSFGGAGASGEF